MKLRQNVRCIIPLSVVLLSGIAFAAPERSSGEQLRRPISFERNVGQAPPSVQFLSHGNRATLFVMAGGETLLRTSSGTFSMRLTGAASRAGEGIEPLSGKIQYLIGNNRNNWHTDVPAYAAIRFESVYPGVDLIYHVNE